MAQDDKPDSMDNKIDALAAMAGGKDIAHEGFNAVEEVPDSDETGQSDAAAALVAQSSAAEAQSAVPVVSSGAVSRARRARANTLQKQRARVHAEQFKRMMVPILLITGVLLLFLGGIVAFMMRGSSADAYTGSGMLNNPTLKRIMVITSFPLGAILLVGAWFFRADIKRGEAAARRENARDDG
ncbi:MAG: hypothetical protein QGG42_00905 [Phycisphaerae bacterium]|nr:hypothetical protein [Phycisphaerae bacterium]